MARSLASASNQFLRNTSGAIAGEPITMAAWFYPATSHDGTMVCLGNNGGFGFYRLGVLSTGEIRAQHQSDGGGTTGIADSSASYTTGAWQHAVGVFTGSTSRACYKNGANKGTNTTSVTSATPDFTTIGAIERASVSTYFNGRIAHAALWSASLTDDEVADLYNNGIGTDPRNIRPDALVAYWPLLDSDGDADWWGQYNLTASGSPTYAAHPPVLMKSRPRSVVITAGGGGGFQPAWARYTNSIIGAGVAG